MCSRISGSYLQLSHFTHTHTHADPLYFSIFLCVLNVFMCEPDICHLLVHHTPHSYFETSPDTHCMQETISPHHPEKSYLKGFMGALCLSRDGPNVWGTCNCAFAACCARAREHLPPGRPCLPFFYKNSFWRGSAMLPCLCDCARPPRHPYLAPPSNNEGSPTELCRVAAPHQL
jgi:hypothetical protein